MSSIGSLRPVTEREAGVAFERLFAIVENQSHCTFIAQEDGERIGFLLMLDELPDEVT